MEQLIENTTVWEQVLKVANDKSCPHVRVCRCGHADYYHLAYSETCYAQEPNNAKDHERENEVLVNCTCDKLDVVIDTNKDQPILEKDYFG